MYFTITCIILYLIILAFLGFLGYKHTKTSQDYMVAGRQIHPIVMALSYGATFISTSAIVGFGGVAGQLGMGVLWLTFLNIFVGIFIAFLFFGKRTRKMGKNLDAHTFPELLGTRFNSKFIQVFSGLIIFIFMPIYAASVLKGGVGFVQSYFGLPFEVCLFGFAAIVAVYVSIGGMKGVMYTDAFQGGIMFLGMVFLLIFTYTKLGGITNGHNQLTNLYKDPVVQEQVAGLVKNGFRGWTSMPEFNSNIWWSLVTSIVMGVGIGVLAQPQLAVRFMTVKSNKELNRAVVSGGIFILMMTGVAFVVGALSNIFFFNSTGKVAMVVGVDNIIPEFIKNNVPGWFGTVFLLSLLSAAMSTLSSQFHTMGTAIGRDVYEKSVGTKKGNTLIITKVAVIAVIIISTFLTYLLNKLDANMAIIAKGTSLFMGLTAAAFLPAYIGALYFKRMPKLAAEIGMVAGFVSGFFWIFFIHGSNAKSLMLCNFLFGKPFLVQGTSLEFLSNYDPVIIGLPFSILVTALVWVIVEFRSSKVNVPHIEKCFQGI